MKKKFTLALLVALYACVLHAQDINSGIGTKSPSSNLEVNGSMEGRFLEVTGNYTLTESDYHVSYSGSSDATISMAAKSSTDNSSTDFRGRKYFVKNNSQSGLLTLSAASGDNFRFGGSIAEMNAVLLKAGYLAIITANGESGWDLDIIQNGADRNWILEYTDLNGFINTSQNIPTGTSFTTINNCSLTIKVPPYAVQNRVMLNFTGWGDVLSDNAGTGSLRFQLQQTGTSNRTYPSIMMSSWATSHNTQRQGVRYNFPVVYTIEDLPEGTYTFTLQLRREGEFGAAPNPLQVWGVQSVGNVFIKVN